MKTAILKINNVYPVRSGKSKISIISNRVNKRTIFWSMMAILMLMLGSYIYFVTQTILNTASYEIIEQKITVLDSKIGELEFEQISLKRDVNLSLAKTLGYIETSDVKFIDKNTSSKTLSLVGKTN